MKKININVIDKFEKEHKLVCDEEISLMELLIENNIDGIDADCGGACSCATCHVYILANSTNLSEKTVIEESMLEMAFEPQENSRLSCQITLNEDIDGLKIKVPKMQQ